MFSRRCAALLVALCFVSVSAIPAQDVAARTAAQKRFAQRLVAAAVDRTRHEITYDPAYVKIPYPGGDVPTDRGVCSDVVIRAYRKLGVDLQQKVHEDMRAAFAAYPKRWGLTRPDTNIDHRRVPNLAVFFARHGQSLPVSEKPEAYFPGDIVTWDLGGGVPHIGIVTDRRSRDGKRPLLVHNIGAGPKLEDVLGSWRRTGHYRYFGD
ncbi:MAG: DUF1287 domain-containing protein [Candidatus Lernaella stagnicola]|nr:DUF1287 domain-containing protein [Candidatus Lernaella stagnicola]